MREIKNIFARRNEYSLNVNDFADIENGCLRFLNIYMYELRDLIKNANESKAFLTKKGFHTYSYTIAKFDK